MPASILRDLFNTTDYEGKVREGVLVKKDIESRHPAKPKAQEPLCTRSMLVGYYAGEERVAIAHEYRRKDGTLGASGKPDPKGILQAGELLIPSE